LCVPESEPLTSLGQIDSTGRKTTLASMLSYLMARANLKHLVEDAEMRVQRGQRRLDHQREAVAALGRAGQDATTAKRVVTILEKVLAIHVADQDRLTKRLARPPR
jgi:hypothetical protein